jgi:hypothetical protein
MALADKLQAAYRCAIEAQGGGDKAILAKLRCLWVWSFIDFGDPDRLSRLIILLVGLWGDVCRLFYPDTEDDERRKLSELKESIEKCIDHIGMMVDTHAGAIARKGKKR